MKESQCREMKQMVTRYMNLLELPVEFTGVAGDNCLADFESDKTVLCGVNCKDCRERGLLEQGATKT